MERLKDKEFVILDGAFGTMLQKNGLKVGEKSELFTFENEEVVYNVHKMYVESGSDILYANTFGANRVKMALCGKGVEEIIEKNVSVCKRAAEGKALVALDIGPIGELLEPNGSMKFEEAYDIFREMVLAGDKAGCDLIAIETMTDMGEMRAAVLAAKENSSLPVIATMSFEANGRTFSGTTPEAAAVILTGLGAEAIGINCSLGPDEIYPIASVMAKYTHLPLVIKANAGLPDPKTGEYGIDDRSFGKSIAKFSKIGAKFIGGCCGTDPGFIRCVKKELEGLKCERQVNEAKCIVCSSSKSVKIDTVKIIGERINPTGKKVFREAIKENNLDYVIQTAVTQTEAGADILDVNVGVAGIDEASMMAKCVKAIQAVTDLPLQIDSTKPDAIEAGLRVYNGKAIVNSVNGEDKVLDSILPIVKKYGASVVGLTLDENGIPKKWQDRVEIAKKILKRANEYGIASEDVFIDALTLTISTEQDAVYETLRALKYVKEEMGLKTVLGVSNISFGLPKRGVVNSAFLTLAMEYGLDLPIINPNDDVMMGAVLAFNALKGYDKDCDIYTKKMSEAAELTVKEEKSDSIEDAVLKGLKSETVRICRELLKGKDELSIVNEHLIPALDTAGNRYEKGIFFLPQLLSAANTAKEAFDVLKESIEKKGGGKIKKGRIILATVKGDIHDIGKNIVKVILENYGYEVIDLGKDVKSDDIVRCAKEENIKLIGLSALMTTTLPAMEETIKKIREAGLESKVMVGGAVLTKSYAESIGADYYSKDAKEAADIAKEVFK